MHATLAGYLPAGAREGIASMQVAEGARVADVIRVLGVPTELSRIVLVNGHDVEDDEPLRSGDVIDIFPPLAGGAEARMVHSEGSGSV